jgi:hypothetical protein
MPSLSPGIRNDQGGFAMNSMARMMAGCLAVLAGAGFSARPAGATLANSASTPQLAVSPQLFNAGEDGNVNPSFTLNGVAGYGSITISYGPVFNGQSVSNPLMPPITVSGSPSGPLALTGSANVVKTTVEIDNNEPVPNTEVLGGLPSPATNGFGGPIAILFSQGVSGVTLTAGYFDTIGATTITAYDSGGNALGQIVNQALGYETFNLSDPGGPLIGGLLLTSSDAGGFGIDGVGVYQAPMTSTAAPAPGPLTVLPGFVALWLARRRIGWAGGDGQST